MEHQKTLASFVESSTDSGTVLSKHCLSDDELLSFARGEFDPSRIEEAHTHLDGCVICQQLVTEAAHALDAEPAFELVPPGWSAVFHPGALVAKRYRIQRMIERGGMGEVYEAFDSILHERVALKTVTATHCDSAQAIRLLKAEVQHARRIGHPNVCRIFDLGTHVMEPAGGEIQFLVMEFIEGEALGKKLRAQGPLSVEVANSVAHQLLRGLAAAHQAGILHRDFKSDNVMLRAESNGRVTAVILDFGLARVLNESGNTVTTQQHQSQALVGTIGYMAPEQVEGEPLSAASDVYAFGVVWFEMLTGRLPFAAQTPAASAVARLHRRPEPPSKYNPRVPAWVDGIVMRCLSRYRESRFTSAEAVLGALAAGPSYSKQPARILERAWRQRLPIALGLLAGGSIPLVLSLVLNEPEIPIVRVEQARPSATQIITTSGASNALRAVGPRNVELPSVPLDPPRPKARKFEHYPAGPSKRAPAAAASSADTPGLPVASVAALAPEPPPATTDAPLPAPDPDWLPLSGKTKALEVQLQVE